MSVVDDSRKLIQDFLAPELREIATRLDALERRMEDKFHAVDSRLEIAERWASERHAQVLQALAQLADVSQLKERVARIEAREKAS